MNDLLYPDSGSNPLSTAEISHHGVLAAAATGLEAFIGTQGGDPRRVFQINGINRDLLFNPTASLGLPAYCGMLEEAAHDSGQDNFGLRYGQQFQPQSLGLIGYIGLSSRTLAEAVRNVAEDFCWHQHDTMTRVVDSGDCWRLEYQIRHCRILIRRQDAELTLGMFLNLIRTALGRTWIPREVLFEHPKPRQWREHDSIFGAPIRFDEPCNAIVIPKEDLTQPMPGSDPTLLLVLRETIRRVNGNACLGNPTLAEQARAQMRFLLPQGKATLNEVAHRLKTMPWVLQRRLKEEGTTFLDLLDMVRRELATQYMRQNNLSISEMSLLLGYSEISAYSRAFKRWFDITPRAWRKQNPGVVPTLTQREHL